MSASILIHWPGATEDESEGHPGFYNDDQAWASWIVAVIERASAVELLERLGVGSLLSHTSDGEDSDEIEWTTPDELERAAKQLLGLVERSDPAVQPLVELYQLEALGEEAPNLEFARDLRDVMQIADYARGLGAQTVTLGYYW